MGMGRGGMGGEMYDDYDDEYMMEMEMESKMMHHKNKGMGMGMGHGKPKDPELELLTDRYEKLEQ